MISSTASIMASLPLTTSFVEASGSNFVAATSIFRLFDLEVALGYRELNNLILQY